MPIVRKVWSIGNSKAISLPKSWLDYIEKNTGKRVLEVAIEVNGDLKISPILEVSN
jgi:antitoxin component of MazEF toxin-antitoxin module